MSTILGFDRKVLDSVDVRLVHGSNGGFATQIAVYDQHGNIQTLTIDHELSDEEVLSMTRTLDSAKQLRLMEKVEEWAKANEKRFRKESLKAGFNPDNYTPLKCAQNEEKRMLALGYTKNADGTYTPPAGVYKHFSKLFSDSKEVVGNLFIAFSKSWNGRSAALQTKATELARTSYSWIRSK